MIKRFDPQGNINITTLPYQMRYNTPRVSPIKLSAIVKMQNTLEILSIPLRKKNVETVEPIVFKDVGKEKLQKKYNELFDRYLSLTAEINELKSENKGLKLHAYKSYDDLKEEMDYDICCSTMQPDSLLILMELRENKKLTYMELKDRVTKPGVLFLRISDLFKITFIGVDKKSEEFFITSIGIGFLEKRGL